VSIIESSPLNAPVVVMRMGMMPRERVEILVDLSAATR
jgi:hypothetical protein